MRTSDRLIARLRKIGLDLPEGTQLVRVMPSGAMRNEGAWSWAAIGPTGAELRIGSQFSMSDLIAAPALVVSSIDSGPGHDGADLEIVPAHH